MAKQTNKRSVSSAGSALTQRSGTRTVVVNRDASTGRVVVANRIGNAVKDAKARYGEVLRRLK